MAESQLMANQNLNSGKEEGQGNAIPVSQIGLVASTRSNRTAPIPYVLAA